MNMVQVQIVISRTRGRGFRIESNILRREDADEAEQAIAEALEQGVLFINEKVAESAGIKMRKMRIKKTAAKP
jgi:hypothetical protein